MPGGAFGGGGDMGVFANGPGGCGMGALSAVVVLVAGGEAIRLSNSLTPRYATTIPPIPPLVAHQTPTGNTKSDETAFAQLKRERCVVRPNLRSLPVVVRRAMGRLARVFLHQTHPQRP